MDQLVELQGDLKRRANSLYQIKSLTGQLQSEILNYSAFKYGSKRAIDLFTDLLVARIKLDEEFQINKDNRDGFLLSFPSLAQIPPVHQLGIQIAEELKIDYVPIVAKSPNKLEVIYGRMATFNERYENRKHNEMFIPENGELLENKIIIFIDDAITSCATAVNVKNLLEPFGIKDFKIYTIFAINSSDSSFEDILNNQFLVKRGVQSFVEIVNNVSTIISRNTLQSIYEMNETDTKRFMNDLGADRRSSVIALLKDYYKCDYKRFERKMGFSI